MPKETLVPLPPFSYQSTGTNVPRGIRAPLGISCWMGKGLSSWWQPGSDCMYLRQRDPCKAGQELVVDRIIPYPTLLSS